jgi:O-antigen ligase
MNIKSFWIRLLAETGIVGFVFFVSWYATLARAGFSAWSSSDPLLRMLGLAGLFMLVGFLAEGFSVDSYALPYLWFGAAMLSAGAFWARRQLREANR